MSTDSRIDRVSSLTAKEFHERYVRQCRPVVVNGGLNGCAALSEWTLSRLRRDSGEKTVPLKSWRKSKLTITHSRLGDYIDRLNDYEAVPRDDGEVMLHRPAYLHDVPLTSLIPRATVELGGRLFDFDPDWYAQDWPLFAQLFLGPSGSVTPLHFDCLLTHNLFFQIFGSKTFTLFPKEQLRLCYPYDWRWCAVDVEHPDFDRHPLYREAVPRTIRVEAGDVLYMPPGTLHHVRSHECALSFNIDWHTRRSVIEGIFAYARGMPKQNVYYNAIIALGLYGGVPPRSLLRYYGSYLNYVS